jgi:hypothetical protein
MRLRNMSILLVVFCLSAVGCATTRMYPGAALDSEQICVIEGVNPYHLGNFLLGRKTSARVRSVDRIQVEGRGYKVEVLPGWHRIVYSISDDMHTQKILFKAGCHYMITTDSIGESGTGIVEFE